MILTATDQPLYFACLTPSDVALAGILPPTGTLATPFAVIADADLTAFLAATQGTRSEYRPLPDDGGVPGEIYGVGDGLVLA